MSQIINRIKEDFNKLKSNYLVIGFLVCSAMIVLCGFLFLPLLGSICNALIVIVLDIFTLAVFLYLKDDFSFRESKDLIILIFLIILWTLMVWKLCEDALIKKYSSINTIIHLRYNNELKFSQPFRYNNELKCS